MIAVASLLALTLLAPASGGLLYEVEQQLVSSLEVVTTSLEEFIASLFSSKCTDLKQFLNETYGQMEEDHTEPDLSSLSLKFITRDSYETFNLTTAAEELPKSGWFNSSNGLIIYCHGYLNSADSEGPRNVTNAFLSLAPYNIVSLDSSSVLAAQYLQASTYTVYIGKELGKVLAAMYEHGLKPESIYLIGHSLGAHISSYTAKNFYGETGHKVGRITGLDPAGPCFTTLNDTLKLSKEDADFVDAIHTNAGVFGLKQDVGHVDIYPNGGSTQPDCILPTCSHGYSWEVFAETVLFPGNFTSVACDSWADFKNGTCNYSDTCLMGFGCDLHTRGRYYLRTSGSIPYGMAENGTTY